YAQIEKYPDHPVARILHGNERGIPSSSFKKALSKPGLSVIAEIKRKSPSKGMIAPISNPLELAHRYIAGGADALSILTDKQYFGGDIHDLQQVALHTHQKMIPIIRKDFMIDIVQIAEAAFEGASSILCIVAVLCEKTRVFI